MTDAGDPGRCPVCGRPRTRSPTGAPVSCCARGLVAPKRPSEASSVTDAVAGLLDRALLRAPRSSSRQGCVAAVVVAFMFAAAACAGFAFWLR